MTETNNIRLRSVKLFAISFTILFLEMACIRWLNASISIMAYFNNLVLISCFFGIGVGCLCSSQRVSLIKWYPLTLFLMVIAVAFLKKHEIAISYTEDVIFAANPEFYEHGLMRVSLSALAGFLINMALFVIMGQELGNQLEGVSPPLKAYAYNIGGSLAGTLAFALLAWHKVAPHWWYIIGSLPLLVFLVPVKSGNSLKILRESLSPRATALLLCNTFLFVAAMALMTSTYADAIWSPYYKVEASPYSEWENKNLGHKIIVNNLRIEDALNFSPQLLRSPLRAWFPYYQLPYHFVRPEKTLVLGAGCGNEAVVAAMHGAQEIHVVEIDPVITRFGQTLHPNRPYSDKRVKVFVDDARSYISKTEEKYDLILMSALDSHTQISGMSSLRLESFMYTVESFRKIKELLKPRGVFCLNLSSTRPWMGERVYWSFAEAFGEEPKLYQSKNSPFRSIAYVWGPDEILSRDLLPQAAGISRLPQSQARKNARLATDNWPYLYLKSNIIPRFCLIVFGVAMLLSILIVGGIERSVGKPNFHFFFLGAGFMLLETRSITQMALVFGSTWNVNAIVFSSILLAIFAANFLVYKGKAPSRKAAYWFLFITLLLGFYFPFTKLLELKVASRLAISCVVIGLPIAWASFIFSHSLKNRQRIKNVFGSNLLGVVLGGALEYTSNIWGLNVLYLVAIVLYALSFIFLPRKDAVPSACMAA